LTLQAQRAVSLEEALSAKAEELLDIKRRTIGFERQVGTLESEMRGIRNDYETLKKENAALKTRLVEGGQDLRKSFLEREAENEKQAQQAGEELASTSLELRE
jgi:regulator of replication initiation timing